MNATGIRSQVGCNVIAFKFAIREHVYIPDAEVKGRVRRLEASADGRSYQVSYFDDDKVRQLEWFDEDELEKLP